MIKQRTLATLSLMLFLGARLDVSAGTTSLVGWGDQYHAFLVEPLAGLTNIIAVSIGYEHTLALTSDGQVFSAGIQSYGQTNVPSGLSNVVAIAAGPYRSLALRNNGSVVAWGQNLQGTASVPDGLTDIAAISVGSGHNLVLRSNGTVFAWGNNSNGQTNIPAACFDIVAISAGGSHNLALRRDGVVVAWGSNGYGQTSVPEDLGPVRALCAGGQHSVAVKKDGRVVVWGYNQYGQTNVPPGLSNVVSVASGWYHIAALKEDGTVVTWGRDFGQTAAPEGLKGVRSVAACQDTTMAVVHDGPPSIASQPRGRIAFTGTDPVLQIGIIGALPLGYQWQRNGSDITGGTNALLCLSNIQMEDAGSYRLIASNAFGQAVSSNINLSVTTSPPVFTLHPVNTTCLEHSNAFFGARVSGSEPIGYRWQFNGADLMDATNSWLTVTKAQLTNEGNYRLVASNMFGTSVSSNAFLAVADLAGALNARNLIWTNSGVLEWTPQTLVSHGDGAAVSLGPISTWNGGKLQTTVVGPGTLSFWWRMDKMGGVSFRTDSFGLNTGTGFPWQQMTFFLKEGPNTLVWDFYGQNPGTAWLDEVTWRPGGSPPILTNTFVVPPVYAGTNVTLIAPVDGHLPISYQWQFEGKDILGATNKSLTVTNAQLSRTGVYTFHAANAYGQTNVSANLSVLPAPPGVWWQPTNQTAVVGGKCVFSVTALGSDPSFQWLFNGNPIQGATNSILILPEMNESRIGNYSVVISNSYGTMVSSNAGVQLVTSKLIAWGEPFRVTSVPQYASNVMAVVAGDTSVVAWHKDGHVSAWGMAIGNSFPPKVNGIAAGSWIAMIQTNGTVVTYPPFAPPPPGLSNVVAISGGSQFFAALREDGTVVSWGNNLHGETNVPVGLSNVVAVDCGAYHTLALKEDGSVIGWGQNSEGQINIPSEATNVLAIAAGVAHNLALRRDGSVIEWGTPRYAEGYVPPKLTDIVDIDTGHYLFNPNNMAIKSDGTLVVWGSSLGGLQSLPLVATNVMDVAAGDFYCLALLGDGTPSLCRPMANQMAFVGSTVTFNSSAVGNAPMSYQWRFNDEDLPAGTNALLVLTNVSTQSAGRYQCYVRNALGSVVTTNATLTVLRRLLIFGTEPGSFFPASDGVHLRLLNASGETPITIETSEDLVHWELLQVHPPASGVLEVVDPDGGKLPVRYYRAREN